MSKKNITKKNLSGDQNEMYLVQAREIRYFGGIPHVEVVSRFRGYGGSEHIVKYWQPIGRK